MAPGPTTTIFLIASALIGMRSSSFFSRIVDFSASSRATAMLAAVETFRLASWFGFGASKSPTVKSGARIRAAERSSTSA